MTELTKSDLEQLSEKKISPATVKEQIKTFREGIPYISLENPAIPNKGIIRLSPEQEEQYIQRFGQQMEELSLLKFVPASGAASRMFKSLFQFLEDFQVGKETLESYAERVGDDAMTVFAKGLQDFPFYKIVQNRIMGQATSKEEELYLFVKEMLHPDKLNYGFYPKGLLPFHDYGDYVATAFEEHLKEAADYAGNGETARLHFTISEQHGDLFNTEFSEVKERASHQARSSFQVSYSYQKQSTDTIAVDPDNNPFRNEDGTLLFRPGGHGALIENLDEVDADIVFIKNIDNVGVPEYARLSNRSKKVLAGLLLELQERAFSYAQLLEGSGQNSQLKEIKEFLENKLNVRFPANFNGFSLSEQLEILRDKLHRPIRICGMVKNEGEPGGGPFWVRDKQGNVSLQIVESAQVNLEDPGQKEIFGKSTHFNPVDLVCGIRDHKKKKFRLTDYVDPKQGFITSKTSEGKKLKALELPGLWNGAMAYWHTVFVEVPLKTFNPVKTVNDLLKPAHQNSREEKAETKAV